MDLHIDIETYSSVDLTKSGVYKYVESPDFEVLMIAYSVDDGEPLVLDLMTDSEYAADDYHELVAAIKDPDVIKHAHNAAFERLALSKMLGVDLPVESWRCTMVRAAMCGLPLSLDAVAKALGTAPKDAAGKSLIRYFTMPCKPTAANGGRTRNLPGHAPEKWRQFLEYCRQDVRAEVDIYKRLAWFGDNGDELELWRLDQKINDRGIMIDRRLVSRALEISAEHTAHLVERGVRLTGLENPNSVAQLRGWLETETGETVATLRKSDVADYLGAIPIGAAREVLEIRQELSKTSVKKYAAMAAAVCADDRVRGLVQFYGANRTGRWAGRLVQVQNLPKNDLAALDLARRSVMEDSREAIELLFGSVPDTLSQLIRTAFIAGPGKKFIVADFSAIEARVLAWLAGEKWRLDVFNTHGKIYEASASQMFRVPLESITKGNPLRQKGKVAELALGYQGGVGAMVTMGALKMGLTEDELPGIVKAWRAANRKITAYWAEIEDSATEAIDNPGYTYSVGNAGTVRFRCSRGALFVILPSGRKLVYLSAKLVPGQYGRKIVYMGMDQTTKKWTRQDTYGGKLVENITQAVARDCLAYAMRQLDAAGFDIVMHVHDEVVIEAPADTDTKKVDAIMSRGADWANGLPLTADSYETTYYRKD